MGSTVTYLRESIPQYVEEPEDIEVSPGELKTAMRQLAGGVSVVTAGFDEGRTGATVTSATALSVQDAETDGHGVNLQLAARAGAAARG